MSHLKWEPPDYSEYTVVNVPASGAGTNGRFFPDLDSSTDYLFVFPNETRTGVVRIEGGRNIVIIGGDTERAVEAGGFQDQDRRCLYFVDNVGDIWIEGMYIHANSNGDPYDAIYVVNTTEVATAITIQNCRIEGVTGSSGGFHGDAFQMQDSSEFNGTIWWYRCTVTTNYQGYYALHEGTDTVTTFEDVNFDITSQNGACLWIGDNGNDYWSRRYTEFGPNVYLDPAGSHDLFDQVRPNTDCVVAAERPVLNDGVMTWPNSDYITGELHDGDPPGGDYVLAENVGVGYVSPGYGPEDPPSSGRRRRRMSDRGRPLGGEVLTLADTTDQAHAIPFDEFPGIRKIGVVADDDVYITIGGTSERPTGGAFTVTYSAEESDPIPYNATAAEVQAVLEAVTTIDEGNVSVTGGPLPGKPVFITFIGDLEETDIALLTTTDSLTGGVGPETVVTEVTKGDTGVNEVQSLSIVSIRDDLDTDGVLVVGDDPAYEVVFDVRSAGVLDGSRDTTLHIAAATTANVHLNYYQ